MTSTPATSQPSEEDVLREVTNKAKKMMRRLASETNEAKKLLAKLAENDESLYFVACPYDHKHYMEAQTVNPSMGEVSVEKRSSPKETSARFLQVSRSPEACGNQKKDVTTIEAHVPILVNIEASLPGETEALQKNRGKRSSPQNVREEENADLVKPVVEDKKLDVMSEQPKNHDNSPVKKQCLELPGHDLEAALSKAAVLKSTIDQTIKCYLENVSAEFTRLKGNSEQNGISNYGERTGIVVPQFADPCLRSMMCYVQTDLKCIHKWIAAPVLDKVALSTQIRKILSRWGAMLQDKIPEEVQELMNELERLSKNLNSKVEHEVPFIISQLRADVEHVKDEVKQRKEEYLVKVKKLNDALGIVSAKLSLEKEHEEKLNQLHSHCDVILNGASDALSRFEEILAQGSSCLESINKAIEEIESLGDSELPVSLREQLKFVESCVIEGVEENDE